MLSENVLYLLLCVTLPTGYKILCFLHVKKFDILVYLIVELYVTLDVKTNTFSFSKIFTFCLPHLSSYHLPNLSKVTQSIDPSVIPGTTLVISTTHLIYDLFTSRIYVERMFLECFLFTLVPLYSNFFSKTIQNFISYESQRPY